MINSVTLLSRNQSASSDKRKDVGDFNSLLSKVNTGDTTTSFHALFLEVARAPLKGAGSQLLVGLYCFISVVETNLLKCVSVSLKFQSSVQQSAAYGFKLIVGSADLILSSVAVKQKQRNLSHHHHLWNSGRALLSVILIQICRCFLKINTENIRFSANAGKQIVPGVTEVPSGFGFGAKPVVP